MAYEIVRYKPEHRAQVVDLQKHLWNPDREKGSRYFAWKYECNPYLTEPIIYLALDGEEVVGMRGFFGTKWEISLPPQRYIVPYADDFVIAPEHRDKGLFTMIMQKAFADLADSFEFVVNLSAGPVTFIGSIGMGWNCVGSVLPTSDRPRGYQLDRLWRNSRIRRAAGKMRNFIGAPAKAPFATIDRRAARRTSTGPLTISCLPRVAEMADLVTRLPYKGQFRHVRDEEYLQWRFQNPLRRYRFVYWDTDVLEGYVVLESKKWPTVQIVDWEATSDEVRYAMINAVRKWAGTGDLSIWLSTVPGASRSRLEAMGFHIAKSEPSISGMVRAILIAPLSGRGEDKVRELGLADPKNWDLRMLYSMRS